MVTGAGHAVVVSRATCAPSEVVVLLRSTLYLMSGASEGTAMAFECAAEGERGMRSEMSFRISASN